MNSEPLHHGDRFYKTKVVEPLTKELIIEEPTDSMVNCQRPREKPPSSDPGESPRSIPEIEGDENLMPTGVYGRDACEGWWDPAAASIGKKGKKNIQKPISMLRPRPQSKPRLMEVFCPSRFTRCAVKLGWPSAPISRIVALYV